MENKDIDQLFQKAFHDAEQEVHPEIWDRIQEDLDKRDKKIFTPVFGTLKWLSYAAAVLLVFGIGYLLLKENDTKQIVEENEIVVEAGSPTGKGSEELQPLVSKDALPAEKSPASERERVKQPSPETSEQVPMVLSSVAAEQHKVPTMDIELLETVSIDLPYPTSEEALPISRATEVGPIQPLVVFEEEEESMYASNNGSSTSERGNTVVTNILNKLSENVDIRQDKEVRFSSDGEGTISIDWINSLARNRKKRK